MPQAIYRCPLCGEPVGDDEDFVTALEHEIAHEITLHGGDYYGVEKRVERRFHVEHFRGHIGDCTYELIHD